MKKLLIELFTKFRGEVSASIKDQNTTQEITPIEVLAPIAVQVTSKSLEQHTYSPESSEWFKTRYFKIDGGARKIAYSISGNPEAAHTLLCLPGLLETKTSFAYVHAHLLPNEECNVISIDFSGRGQSDSIDSQDEYKMSMYLNDVSQFISENILTTLDAQKKITVLGTSMGGVLAMYLTQRMSEQIECIILNDIALKVNRTSLYSLYKSMKNQTRFKGLRELAKDLRVDEQVISDVQQPGHFDLPYKADVWGMNFHEALDVYRGKIALIYGDKSTICTKQRVLEAKAQIPRLATFAVAGAGHPTPLNAAVCDFIQKQIRL